MAEQLIHALYIVDEQASASASADDAVQSFSRRMSNGAFSNDALSEHSENTENGQSMQADKGHQWTNKLCGLRSVQKQSHFDQAASPVKSQAQRPLSRLEQTLLSEIRQSIASGNLTQVSQALRTVADYPDVARRVLNAARSIYIESAGLRLGFVETVDQDKQCSLTLRIGSVEVDPASGEKSATVITIGSNGARSAQRWSATSGSGMGAGGGADSLSPSGSGTVAAVETIDPAMAFRRLLAMSKLDPSFANA